MSSAITNRDKTRWRKPPALTAPHRIVQTRRPSVVRNNKNPLHLYYNIPFGVDMTTIILLFIIVV